MDSSYCQFYKDKFNPNNYITHKLDCLLDDESPLYQVKLLHNLMEQGKFRPYVPLAFVHLHNFIPLMLYTCISNTFSGDIHGTDLLEVGCGPSILFSIVPSQYFNNLFLSDYVKRNIEIIQTWLDDKPGQVYFQPFFDFAGKCMGKG